MKIDWGTFLTIVLALIVVMALQRFVLDKAFGKLEEGFETTANKN